MAKGYISVSEEKLASFFTEGTNWKIIAGIPEGAIYKGSYVDVSKKEFVFIFEHNSIPPNPSGKVSKVFLDLRQGK